MPTTEIFERVPVVGMHFREEIDAQAIADLMTEETEIIFNREPDNPYDPWAIQVIVGNAHIGYVQAQGGVALAIAPLMDAGAEVTAVCVGHDKPARVNYPLLDITVTTET